MTDHLENLQAGTQRCPICKKVTVAAYKPFCSKRCADVDLSRWLNGAYVISAANEDEADSVPADYPEN